MVIGGGITALELVEGLTPEELYACSVGARKALRAHWDQIEQIASDRSESNRF